MRRTPGRRDRPLTQALITRTISRSSLSGAAARATRAMPPGAEQPIESRQRRRQRERDAAARADG